MSGIDPTDELTALTEELGLYDLPGCDICGKPMLWRGRYGWLCRDCDNQ